MDEGTSAKQNSPPPVIAPGVKSINCKGRSKERSQLPKEAIRVAVDVAEKTWLSVETKLGP